MILRGIRDPFSIILLCKFKKFKYTRGGGGEFQTPPSKISAPARLFE